MKALLLSGLALLSLSAMAHEDHDWRTDIMAFLSVEYEIPFAPEAPKWKHQFKAAAPSRLDMDFFKATQRALRPHTLPA